MGYVEIVDIEVVTKYYFNYNKSDTGTIMQEQSSKERPNILERLFGHKIVSLEHLVGIVGQRPRDKKVVMCSGTFDLGHPGQSRQIGFAKTKGDVLVIRITPDRYANKGEFRPYLTENLRALDVAAYEDVDYVIIDQSPTAAETILKIQPEIFVRGFEHSHAGISQQIKEEDDAISSYEGELIFSSGDLAYPAHLSLKERLALNLDARLLILMEEEGITFNHLRLTVEDFRGIKVFVIGDLIVDLYTFCDVSGTTQKSNAFSANFIKSERFVGGAGIVAKHLCSLGAEVTLTTVTGEDEAANFALENLASEGVVVQAIRKRGRRTTVKERFINANSNQLLLQVNRLDNTPIFAKDLESICRVVEDTQADVCVCSDFRHGIFNSESVKLITEVLPNRILRIADSQVSSRWGNILDFKKFDLITPNEREARWTLGDQDTGVRPLAQALYNRAECRYLILKLGAKGIITYRSPGGESREYFYIDAFTSNPVDPIGAGDALLAASTLALAASKDIVQASILGNLAAAIETSKQGNIAVTAGELLLTIDSLKSKTKA